MDDAHLDLLYRMCYTQMIRIKYCPTYVEKKILDDIVTSIKGYILSFLEKIKDNIKNKSKKDLESYLTWDIEYYKKECDNNKKIINDFEYKIINTESNTFLKNDFSKTNTMLDTLHPNFLPISKNREFLWDLIVKNK